MVHLAVDWLLQVQHIYLVHAYDPLLVLPTMPSGNGYLLMSSVAEITSQRLLGRATFPCMILIMKTAGCMR